MFWIAILILGLSWLLIKFGFLSATAGILISVIKLLVLIIILGVIAAIWIKFRKRDKDTEKVD